MAAADPALDEIEKTVARTLGWLQPVAKSTLPKVLAMQKSAAQTLRRIIDNPKAFLGRLGASILKDVRQYGTRLMSRLPLLAKLGKEALKLGFRIIALIRKAANPSKIIGTLKKLFARYLKLFRSILSYVTNIVKDLAPLEKALAAIDAVKKVLQLIIKWIAGVTGALNAVKKIKSILKRVAKAVGVQMKQLLRVQKAVAKLKPA